MTPLTITLPGPEMMLLESVPPLTSTVALLRTSEPIESAAPERTPALTTFCPVKALAGFETWSRPGPILLIRPLVIADEIARTSLGPPTVMFAVTN